MATPPPYVLTFPSTSRPAPRINPEVLTLFGAHKIRKTVTCAALPDSLLISCDPGGADHIDCRSIDVRRELQSAIAGKTVVRGTTELVFLVDHIIPKLQSERPAKRIIWDKLDVIEDWLLEQFNTRRKDNLMQLQVDTILEMEYSKGYSMLSEALSRLWVKMTSCAYETIFIVSEAPGGDRKLGQAVETGNADVREVRSGWLDLRGPKCRKLPCSMSACIGKLTQQCPDSFTDRLLVTFRSNSDTATGNRILRLEESEFVLSECKYARGPDNKRVIDPVTLEPKLEYFKTFWERIYLPEPVNGVANDSPKG